MVVPPFYGIVTRVLFRVNDAKYAYREVEFP
jgi:hypothetical protein